MKNKKTQTRGGIVIEEIEVGDIHYEFEYGCCIKSEVMTKPQMVDGMWRWKSRNITTGGEIDYGLHSDYVHYGPNLYDTEAYSGCKLI